MLQSLHHIGIPTTDVEKSLAFYVDIFGFTPTERRMGGTSILQFASFGDLVIELVQPGEGAQLLPKPGLHIAFSVDDIYGMVEKLAAAGYELEKPLNPGATGRMNCFLSGPSGERIELMYNPA